MQRQLRSLRTGRHARRGNFMASALGQMTIYLHSSTVSPQLAFAKAIAAGAFTRDNSAANFAGGFVFMGEGERGQFVFKHVDTCAYIVLEEKTSLPRSSFSYLGSRT